MMGAGVAVADEAAELAKKQAEAVAQAQKAAAEAMKDPEVQKQMAEAQKAAAEAMKDPAVQKQIEEAMKDPAVKKQMELGKKLQEAMAAGDNDKIQAIQKEMTENAQKIQAEAIKKAAK